MWLLHAVGIIKSGLCVILTSLGPRECNVCGELATHECKECYVNGSDLDQITFCKNCLVKVKLHFEAKIPKTDLFYV